MNSVPEILGKRVETTDDASRSRCPICFIYLRVEDGSHGGRSSVVADHMEKEHTVIWCLKCQPGKRKWFTDIRDIPIHYRMDHAGDCEDHYPIPIDGVTK